MFIRRCSKSVEGKKIIKLFCITALMLGSTVQAMDVKSPEELSRELITATRNGNINQVEELLKQGAIIDAKDNYGNTPLMWAAFNGHEQTCKLLIENKASIDAKNNKGYTPLMLAARFGHEQICKLLIENKATIDAKDNDGNTPLLFAALNGSESICKLFIDIMLQLTPEEKERIKTLNLSLLRTPLRKDERQIIIRKAYDDIQHPKKIKLLEQIAKIAKIKNKSLRNELIEYVNRK